MMTMVRKGNSSPAFRYFLFILFLCITLFIFLLSRIASGIETEVDYEGMVVPAYRAVQWSPAGDALNFTARPDARPVAL